MFASPAKLNQVSETIGDSLEVTLRLYDSKAFHSDTNLIDCEAKFVGTRSQADDFARSSGYNWCPHSRNLFGGYYVAPNGDCLMVT